jgi:hypothetical protein
MCVTDLCWSMRMAMTHVSVSASMSVADMEISMAARMAQMRTS